MKRLLILDADAEIYRREIENHNPAGLELITAIDCTQADPYVPDAEIILGRPDLVSDILHRADRLRWVQSVFAGIEPLCKPGLRADYTLTGVKEVFGPLMREYVIGHIIARERSLFTTHDNQQQRTWQPVSYRGLAGLTIGIAGLGSIGRSVAETARHFGMRVLGMKRTADAVDCVDKLFLPHQMDEFLPQLDYLVLVLPDTPDSRGFIGAAELGLLKKSAVLANVGRGVSVNQQDLIDALEAGRIGGAILDVFEEEPLDPESPLWQMSNVVVTPHISAFSFPMQITSIFMENYGRYIADRPLVYQVDFTRGY